jgi:hypothetical protein
VGGTSTGRPTLAIASPSELVLTKAVPAMKNGLKFFKSFRLTIGSRESRYIANKQASAGTALNNHRT